MGIEVILGAFAYAARRPLNEIHVLDAGNYICVYVSMNFLHVPHHVLSYLLLLYSSCDFVGSWARDRERVGMTPGGKD